MRAVQSHATLLSVLPPQSLSPLYQVKAGQVSVIGNHLCTSGMAERFECTLGITQVQYLGSDNIQVVFLIGAFITTTTAATTSTPTTTTSNYFYTLTAATGTITTYAGIL